MTWTLDRLVGRTFLGIFLRFSLCVPVMLIIGDASENFNYHLDRGVEALDIAWGYVFTYPKYMVMGFPIAGLVASVFTVNSMTVHREILAAKGGGVSFRRLFAPLWVIGGALTGAAFHLDEISPAANRKTAEIHKEREMRRDWRTNFVYLTEDGETLTIERLSADLGAMNGVLIESRDPDGSLRHVWANQAAYSGPQAGWTFNEGHLRVVRPGGQEEAYRFGSYRRSRLSVRPDEMLEDPPEEDEMTYAELGRRAESVMRSGGDARKLLVRREQKRALAAATFVVVLLGIPLATTSRKGGAAFGISLSLSVTIVYYLLLQLFGAVGESGAVAPWLAAWLPNLFFFAVGVLLAARVRT